MPGAVHHPWCARSLQRHHAGRGAEPVAQIHVRAGSSGASPVRGRVPGPNYLELPGGIIDEREDPVEAGMRELREETGYGGKGPRLLGTFALNPSWQTTRIHVVTCGVARLVGSKKLDRGEDTRVRLVSGEEIPRLISRGDLDNAVALAALALWQNLRNG